MAGHGRTSWDDVAIVTVNVLRSIARAQRQAEGDALLSRRELAELSGVSEYRVHAALRRLVSSGLVTSEERYRPDGGRLANSLSVTEAGQAFLVGLE